MSNIVCCIIFGFFIILGVVDTIEFLTFRMFRISKSKASEKAFVIKDDPESIEYQIRSALAQSSFSGNSSSIKLILPNEPLTIESQKICSALCNGHDLFNTVN